MGEQDSVNPTAEQLNYDGSQELTVAHGDGYVEMYEGPIPHMSNGKWIRYVPHEDANTSLLANTENWR